MRERGWLVRTRHAHLSPHGTFVEVSAPLIDGECSQAMLHCLTVERPRTANETIVPKIEPQQAVGRTRDANPFTQADFVRRLPIRSEPQRAGLTKIDPIQS